MFYPKGTYKVRLTGEYGFGKTPAPKNTSFFEAAFKVLASVDPITKEEKECEQQYERKTTIYLTTATVGKYAFDQLKAIGWDGTSLTRLDRTKPGYQDLEGTEFLAYVKHEPGNNGVVYENWNVSTGEPKSRGPKVACDEGVADDLDSLFGLSPSVTTTPVVATDTAGTEFQF